MGKAARPVAPKAKRKEKSQAERFIETARAIGADETPDALDRAFGKLDLRAKPGATSK